MTAIKQTASTNQAMKQRLLKECILAEEARLYDFVNKLNIIVEPAVGTMGISKNGTLYVCEEFLNANIDYVIGVLLHESLHVFFHHHDKEYSNHQVANVAQDIVINNLVNKIGYDLPEGGCTYESMEVPRTLETSDEIYDYLMDKLPELDQDMLDQLQEQHDKPDQLDGEGQSDGQQGQGSSSGQQEGQEQNSEGGKTDDKKGGKEVRGSSKAMSELAAAAKVLHEDIEYTIYKEKVDRWAIKEKKPFLRSIERTLGSILAPDFERTFTKQRRYKVGGALLPSSRMHVRKPSISIYLDVSGSMSGEGVMKAKGVMESLKVHLSAYERSYYTFNNYTYKVDNLDAPKIGGGTSFDSFHDTDGSDVVLIITDCEFSFDFLEKHSRKKVIVLNVTNRKESLKNVEVYAC